MSGVDKDAKRMHNGSMMLSRRYMRHSGPTVKVQMHIPESLKAALVAAADEYGVSMTWLVVKFTDEGLAKLAEEE